MRTRENKRHAKCVPAQGAGRGEGRAEAEEGRRAGGKAKLEPQISHAIAHATSPLSFGSPRPAVEFPVSGFTRVWQAR
eukprot:5542819-Pyramimonas_sp.AAC.1